MASRRGTAADRPGEMPVRLYIAALGGEGGGVLTAWLVALAAAEGWPVQSTSIPGVAQRTGATTYYVELLPRRWDGPEPPVFALTPTPGFVDIVVATELLEAGRVIEQGFVSPDRTTLIASRHRTYTIEEKSAMGDGRVPGARILTAIETLAARAVVVDFATLAAAAGAVVNSVVLGAIAGTGVLPLSRERFEAVLRGSEVGAEASLRGFAAGFDAVTRGEAGAAAAATEPAAGRWGLPAEVTEIAAHGVERLTDYQDAAYAERYLGHVRQVLEAEREAGGDGFAVTREAARHLALWMSYEDVIRVAALKTRRERWQQIAAANPLGERDVLGVTEFLKPGLEELASVMPPALGRRLIEAARRRGRLDAYNIGLHVRSTSLTGFLIMRMLARLRPWRPRSFRFAEEMAALGAWLDRVVAATRIDPDFGAAVVECARLRKGYGATHRHGVANFDAIMTGVVDPALAAGHTAAERIRELAGAALADPEGGALSEVLARASRPAGAAA